MIGEFLSAGELSGWGLAGVLFLFDITAVARGWVYVGRYIDLLLLQTRQELDGERRRGDQWEAAYHKLEAARELERASERTAFIESVRTLAAITEGVQSAVKDGGGHEAVSTAPRLDPSSG